jgi:hypothetical protein
MNDKTFQLRSQPLPEPNKGIEGWGLSRHVRWQKNLQPDQQKSEVFILYSPLSSFESKLKFGEIWEEFGKTSKMSLILAT